MESWVRYCIAVYVGLLISGALMRPSWTAPTRGSTPSADRAPTAPSPAAARWVLDGPPAPADVTAGHAPAPDEPGVDVLR